MAGVTAFSGYLARPDVESLVCGVQDLDGFDRAVIAGADSGAVLAAFCLDVAVSDGHLEGLIAFGIGGAPGTDACRKRGVAVHGRDDAVLDSDGVAVVLPESDCGVVALAICLDGERAPLGLKTFVVIADDGDLVALGALARADAAAVDAAVGGAFGVDRAVAVDPDVLVVIAVVAAADAGTL